jgi:hypothetical protein
MTVSSDPRSSLYLTFFLFFLSSVDCPRGVRLPIILPILAIPRGHATTCFFKLLIAFCRVTARIGDLRRTKHRLARLAKRLRFGTASIFCCPDHHQVKKKKKGPLPLHLCPHYVNSSEVSKVVYSNVSIYNPVLQGRAQCATKINVDLVLFILWDLSPFM